MEENPTKLIPALIGGSVIGILSTVPIINMGNCLCCMWILLGGFIGTYFYWRELPPGHELSSGEGAVIGLLSGIFGALFGTLLGYFFMAVVGFNPGQEFLQSILESRGDLSPEIEEFLKEFQMRGGLHPFFITIGLFFALVVDSVFGAVGGIIGAAILRKKVKPSESSGTQKLQ